MTPGVRAPQLHGRGWLNTGGRALTLADLRGKIIVLDFWTFCCVNCLHVLDELRPLEARYADVLVVIGVHSPKFEHEKDPVALADAVERYGVAHPVLDDPALEMWRQYTAKAWPTLCVIDPEGYVVAMMAGEGHAEGLARLVEALVAVHEEKATLRRGGAGLAAAAPAPTALRFPGKALALPGGRVLVADSARHSLAELAPDAETVTRRIGSGARGRTDGAAAVARFSEPSGMCLLPPHVAEIAGYDLVVADTVNHLLRGVRLESGEVTTVAGTGHPWRSTVDFQAHDPLTVDSLTVDPLTVDSLTVDLSSPWDCAWFDDRVIVAMAGIHQLWWFDPVERTAGAYAGTTVEALRDGPLREAWMAQPSGVSASPDGRLLWIVDSESSAVRWIEDGVLHTAVGQGLFDFGHVDGPAAEALLQHPLGVLALADGSVLIADTYNGAVRRVAGGPAATLVSTVVTGLAEPSDLVLTDGGDVLVVESAAHRLTRIAPGALDAAGTSAAGTSAAGISAAGARHRTERPPTVVAPGEVTLDVVFEPAPGQKLDESFGPSTRLAVSASPPELLVDGAGVSEDLYRRLILSDQIAGGVLQVTAQAATCDIEAEHPACHLTRQDWGVPVRVAAGGAGRVPLILRGLDVDGAPPTDTPPTDTPRTDTVVTSPAR